MGRDLVARWGVGGGWRDGVFFDVFKHKQKLAKRVSEIVFEY